MPPALGAQSLNHWTARKSWNNALGMHIIVKIVAIIFIIKNDTFEKEPYENQITHQSSCAYLRSRKRGSEVERGAKQDRRLRGPQAYGESLRQG